MEQKFSRFRWNGNETCAAKAKVSWDLVCMLKREGGLGLKKLEVWNRAAVPNISGVFNFANSGSLWVAWCKGYNIGVFCMGYNIGVL